MNASVAAGFMVPVASIASVWAPAASPVRAKSTACTVSVVA